ncbi:MAG: hypothetical protein LBJ21_01045 [Acidobacteriota bacterium]|jgi:hypothetical protein|nr:hypothetical protein [Acidobacteriota bacterium]
MKKKTGIFIASCCCIFAVLAPGLFAKDPSPEQLIAGHLKAIVDAPAALSQIKSITFVGTSEVNFILGMSGNMSGTSMLVSEGPKMGIVMKFQDINYPGEYFAYDGKSVSVGHMKPGLKSPIADFMFRYNKVLKNGMIGGIFSNAWPLLDVKGDKPRNMKVRTTRVDGAELYELEYRPRDDHGDMKIRMYFDPETYRHVRTEYKVSTRDDVTTGFNSPIDGDGMVKDMAIAEVRGESYYTLTEKFDDFKKVGELTLPHSYTLDYMIDGLNQSGFIAKWNINILTWGFNTPGIDPDIFKAEK